MKKSIILLMVMGIVAIGSMANATALSTSTPNVVATTSDAQVILTAPYGSQWVLAPAVDMYINMLNTATINTNYPVITSTNTYNLTMNRIGRFTLKNKNAGTSTITITPASAYVPAR